MPLSISSLIGETTPAWAIIAERRIAEWIESGGADRLTNKGKQLDLSENPFVPREMRMAYRILENAGAAPDWIEIGKDIERLLADCREHRRRYHHQQRGDHIELRRAASSDLERIRERLKTRARVFADEQRSRLQHANHLIDRFNHACPVAHLHRTRLNVESELQRALGSAVDPL